MLLHQENHLKCPRQRAGNQLVSPDSQSAARRRPHRRRPDAELRSTPGLRPTQNSTRRQAADARRHRAAARRHPAAVRRQAVAATARRHPAVARRRHVARRRMPPHRRIPPRRRPPPADRYCSVFAAASPLPTHPCRIQAPMAAFLRLCVLARCSQAVGTRGICCTSYASIPMAAFKRVERCSIINDLLCRTLSINPAGLSLSVRTCWSLLIWTC
jgi:hypothetical protein